MSTYSDPAYEIDGNLDVIRASDVRERIPAILPYIAWNVPRSLPVKAFASLAQAEEYISQQPDPPELEAVTDGDEEEELEALKELLSGFAGLGESAFAVSAGALCDYAEEEAASIDGVTTDSMVYDFIDWKGLAESLKMDMTAVMFRGTEYWIRA